MAQVTRGAAPAGLAVGGMLGRSDLFLQTESPSSESRTSLLLVTQGRRLVLGDKVFLLQQSEATFSTSRLLPQIPRGNWPGRCN